MMSVEEARTLIPDDEQYTNEQIQEIVSTLDALASICFDMWLQERNKPKTEQLDK